MNNKIYKIGDSLVVRVIPKQNGITTISSFSDELIGVIDFNKDILREFRIVEDDFFFGDWQILTESTIIGKKLKQKSVLEVRYTKQRTGDEDCIEFKSIEINGDFLENSVNSPILESSIFANIANEEETEKLAKNLFKKMYFRGIIPNYVLRGDNIDINEDEDFVKLFYAIAKFYAIIFRFFKRFENFHEDYDLLLERIRQNNIQINKSNVSLSQLQYLANHLLDEIRKRGTKAIFNHQGDVVHGVINELDGEFNRLINNTRSDEMIYEYMSSSLSGWCLGKSSPLYRGTNLSKDLNKTKEKTEDFNDLKNYQIFKNGNCAVSIIDNDNKKTALLNVFNNAACGFGRLSDSEKLSENIIVIDPRMDYEITFMFKKGIGDAKLHFGVEAFDVNKNKFLNAFITPQNSITTDYFVDELELSNFVDNKWYFVRGIIHAYDSDNTENIKLNIGYGNNLKFNNIFVKYISPKIYISSKNISSLYIWNYKIRPLVRGTNILPLKNGKENSHSLGFIQSPRILYGYFKNNNVSQSEQEITDIIEKYLLPFDITNIFQFINYK